jgi:hypothetical protein
MNEETPMKCPECHSSLITEICNMKKCLQCGHQFDLDRNPIATRAHNTEKRWPPNPARTP